VFIIAIVLGGLAGALTFPFVQGRSVRFIVAELVAELAFAVTVVAWVRLVSHGPLAALGLPRRPLIDVGAGIGTGVALLLVASLVLYLVRTIATHVIGHTPAEPDQVPRYVMGSALVYLAPVVILAAPLGEELFFRGFLYKGLRRRFSVWPAAMISGAAFGAAHFAGVDFLILIPALFVVGIGLALLYERRQSLLASMAAHATFNLLGFLTIALSRR
jgi:membrane protease YdiL (CAAX protease family)